MEDIPQLVDLYFDTFKSPLVLRIKPDVPPVREWYKKSLESEIQKPYTRISNEGVKDKFIYISHQFYSTEGYVTN